MPSFTMRILLMVVMVGLLSACTKKATTSAIPSKVSVLAGVTKPRAPKLSEVSAARFWGMMASHLTYIQRGHGGPIIYDFTDTNCPYCHIMYNAEEHLVSEGRLTVRYVPVAMIEPSSMSEAVYILQAKSPASELSSVERIIGDNMDNKNQVTLPHVAHILDSPSPRDMATIREIELNNGFLHEIKVDQLPDIIYQRKDGHLGLITGLIGKGGLTSILAKKARVRDANSGNTDDTVAPILMGKNDE